MQTVECPECSDEVTVGVDDDREIEAVNDERIVEGLHRTEATCDEGHDFFVHFR